MGDGVKEIDITKPLRARIFDADESWQGENTLEVDVQTIVLPHPPYTTQPEIIYNGGLSSNFKLLPQDDVKIARKKVEAIVTKNVCTVQMVRDDDLCPGHYVPKECCSMTNPLTSGGISQIDDINLPCGDNCEKDCETCIIQRIMDEYAEITKQTN